MAELQQPNILGNYLSNYYTAQQQQQAQQDRAQAQRRQATQDQNAQEEHDWAAMQRKNEMIARAAMAADTPEKWQQIVPQVAQQLGWTGEIPDFSHRERILSESMSITEQLKQKMQEREFGLQQRVADANIRQSDASAAASLAQAEALRSGGRGGVPGGSPRLTNADKREIYDTDELVSSNKAAIGLLQRASGLNKQAFQGAGSGTVANTMAMFEGVLPDSDVKGAQATLEFDNLIKQQVLPQLKAIFGGMPTEGERKVLLDLQGSTTMPRTVREQVLSNALQLAQARLRFNQEKATGLRSGSYYDTPPSFNLELPTVGGQSQQQQGNLPLVRTPAEFNALPSGALYLEDDGKTYRKP